MSYLLRAKRGKNYLSNFENELPHNCIVQIVNNKLLLLKRVDTLIRGDRVAHSKYVRVYANYGANESDRMAKQRGSRQQANHMT